LRAAGVAPAVAPARHHADRRLRELIAATAEDGRDISDITEVAVQATQALPGPRGPAVR
jgi:hypothetical protein